jgi:hypothetical protein
VGLAKRDNVIDNAILIHCSESNENKLSANYLGALLKNNSI